MSTKKKTGPERAWLAINTAINDDLEFLGSKILEKLTDAEGVLITHKNAKTEPTEHYSVSKVLRPLKASSFAQIFNLKCLFRAVFKSNCKDLYLLSPTPNNIPIIILAKLKRMILSSAVHDVDPHYNGLRGALYSLQNKFIFSYSEKIYAYSEYSKKRLISKYGVSSEKIILTELRTPAERYDLNESKYRNINKCFDFVWWGRAERYKGVSELPAFSDFIQKHGHSLLVISDFSGVPDVYKKLRSRDNVTIIDERLDEELLIMNLMKCKVNLCPYESATQSGVVPFCSYLGIPTVAYDVGALREQIEGLNAGIVVSDLCQEEVLNFLKLSSDNDEARLRKQYHEKYIQTCLVS